MDPLVLVAVEGGPACGQSQQCTDTAGGMAGVQGVSHGLWGALLASRARVSTPSRL
jgi:hypothetical protein